MTKTPGIPPVHYFKFSQIPSSEYGSCLLYSVSIMNSVPTIRMMLKSLVYRHDTNILTVHLLVYYFALDNVPVVICAHRTIHRSCTLTASHLSSVLYYILVLPPEWLFLVYLKTWYLDNRLSTKLFLKIVINRNAKIVLLSKY